jgi:hypothetical protein
MKDKSCDQDALKGIDKHVIGSSIMGYEDYCPITLKRVYPTKEKDVFRIDDDTTVHQNDCVESLGFWILYIGWDGSGEHNEQAASLAIYNSLNSLFSSCDIPVNYDTFHSVVEFQKIFEINRPNFSHIILIGHGSVDGISFIDKDELLKGSDLAQIMKAPSGGRDQQVISLCCHSGCNNWSAALSAASGISEVVAPMGTFDMRWAVHFVTGYLLYQYISRQGCEEALKNAAITSGGLNMCIWKDGTQVGECSTEELEK